MAGVAQISGRVRATGVSKQMTLLAKAFVATAIVGALALAAWKTKSRAGLAPSSSLSARSQVAVSNSIHIVRNRVTGGIGVAVAMDSRGLPVVGAVAVGSPADQGGLYVGDVITKVGGVPTTGLGLPQIAERVRGLSVGSVALTVSRQGTNLEFNIERSSWNAMKDKSYNPYE